MSNWFVIRKAEKTNLKTKKGNANVNNVDCKAVESEMTAKLDSALGGMQAEINALIKLCTCADTILKFTFAIVSITFAYWSI